MTAMLYVLDDKEKQIEMTGMKNPMCCREKMRITGDTGKFLELICARCGDVVYMKKLSAEKPQMIDD